MIGVPAHFSLFTFFLLPLLPLLLPLSSTSTFAAEPLTTVCATDTIDRLPPGVIFKATPKLVKKANKQQNSGSDVMKRSPFSAQKYTVFYTEKVEWADASAVTVTCTITTTLADFRAGGFVLKKVLTEVMTPKMGASLPPWRNFQFNLESVEGDNEAQLVCSTETTPTAPGRPRAPFEKTLIEIGQLQNLLSEMLPLQIRTETDPKRCAAINSQAGLKETTSALKAPRMVARPSTHQRSLKPDQPSEPAREAVSVDHATSGRAEAP